MAETVLVLPRNRNGKSNKLDRRGFLLRGLGAASVLLLSGCGEKLTETSWVPRVLDTAETVNRHVQRFLTPHDAMAREYTAADISRHFKANGTKDPGNPACQALAANQFVDWRLKVSGLVTIPALSHWPSCGPCLRAPRSPATIAWKAGAVSVRGRACRWPRCWNA